MGNKFVLLGAAGFVAPRHMKAIKDVGGDLIAIMDPHDSVGIVDSYFPNASYFSEFERFDRFCSKRNIDYVSICSPNHLHDAHCRFALRIGADAICEKPLILRERNLDELIKLEEKTNGMVWNILQLRLSDVFQNLKKEVSELKNGSTVRVNYYAYRGTWYNYSWKMNSEKSGGIVRNIGIHILDLLTLLFGDVIKVIMIRAKSKRDFQCVLLFDKDITCEVNLSLDIKEEERSIYLNGKKFDLTPKMKELHTISYQEILKGNGFGLEDARAAIRTADMLGVL